MRYLVVGLYDEHEAAEEAFRELQSLRLKDSALHMVSHAKTDLENWSPEVSYWDRGHFGHDMLHRLTDMGFPQNEAELYCEGVRRGGTLIVADVEDAHEERAVEILNRHDPVDVRTRVELWRKLGYTGYDPTAAPYTAEYIRRERKYLSREHTPVTEDRVVRFGRDKYL